MNKMYYNTSSKQFETEQSFWALYAEYIQQCLSRGETVEYKTLEAFADSAHPTVIAVIEPDAKMAAGMLKAMAAASAEFFGLPNNTEEDQKRYDEAADKFYRGEFHLTYHYSGGSHAIKLANGAATWTAIEDAMHYIIDQQ